MKRTFLHPDIWQPSLNLYCLTMCDIRIGAKLSVFIKLTKPASLIVLCGLNLKDKVKSEKKCIPTYVSV